ncbi:hypothetical protein ACFHYQ_10400 [Sphaerimonospora cavernae]|uniref:Uncharacterized protein n=1 Tax=Sphaerimonospora cavernae TaxID=1740611 RepID=A0ABV6U6G6_9ACTN
MHHPLGSALRLPAQDMDGIPVDHLGGDLGAGLRAASSAAHPTAAGTAGELSVVTTIGAVMAAPFYYYLS